MASIYIGANRGEPDLGPDVQTGGIQEGSSTNSTDVEIRIDTGKSLTRHEVKIICTRLLEYLEDGRTAVFPI